MKIVVRSCSPSLVLLPACGGDGSAAGAVHGPRRRPTTVELADFAFRPDCLSADAGATITLENTGTPPTRSRWRAPTST